MALPKNINDIKGFNDLESTITSKPIRGPQFSVIYASGKCGKSTVASYADSPVIVPIGLETGHHSMNVAKIRDMKDGESGTDHVFAALAMLINREHNYKTLILDNLGTFRVEVEKDANVGDKAAFQQAPIHYEYYLRLMSAISTVLKKRNMDVILMAHSVSYTNNMPDGSWHERIHINAPKGQNTDVRAMIEQRAHNIFYMRTEPITRKDERGITAKDSGKKYMTGVGRKMIYTREKENFFAGTRLPLRGEYEIKPSDDLRELLIEKSNMSIIDFWRDYYRDPNYDPNPNRKNPLPQE